MHAINKMCRDIIFSFPDGGDFVPAPPHHVMDRVGPSVHIRVHTCFECVLSQQGIRRHPFCSPSPAFESCARELEVLWEAGSSDVHAINRDAATSSSPSPVDDVWCTKELHRQGHGSVFSQERNICEVGSTLRAHRTAVDVACSQECAGT